MNLNEIPNTAIILVFVGVVFVAGFLVLDGLTDDVACSTGYSYNSAAQTCELDTNTSVTAGLTNAGNSSLNLQTGMDNITSYASTWGTIIGVAVLLGIVIAGFAFGRNRGYF